MKNLIRFCIIAIFAIFSVAAYAQEATEEVIEIELLNPEPEPGPSIFQLYQEGGVLYMSLITLCLVGILLAAWKQPSFVKELGSIALTLGFVSVMIGIQAFLNVAIVTNLFPPTGVQLPFFSKGGTSLLFMMIAVGLVLNISRYQKRGAENIYEVK